MTKKKKKSKKTLVSDAAIPPRDDLLGEGDMFIAEIVVQAYMTSGGHKAISVVCQDPDGELPELMTMLGMLELARDTVYEMAREENQ